MAEYLTALLITIAVEFAVYFVFIRKDALNLLFYSVLINCLTHPPAFYFYSKLYYSSGITDAFNIYFIIIEIIVFLAEILLIKYLLNVKTFRAVLIAFSANFVTASIGFII